MNASKRISLSKFASTLCLVLSITYFCCSSILLIKNVVLITSLNIYKHKAEVEKRMAETTKQKAEADKHNSESEDREIQFILSEQAEKIYSSRHRYLEGENEVSQHPIVSTFTKFVPEYSFSGYSKVEMVLDNRNTYTVKPNVTIYFFNENGFPVASATSKWVFNSMKPGEREVVSESLKYFEEEMPEAGSRNIIYYQVVDSSEQE
jgi:hypothetical protein